MKFLYFSEIFNMWKMFIMNKMEFAPRTELHYYYYIPE